MARDDYFEYMPGTPPVGYGMTREQALGRLSEFLTNNKVHRKSPVVLPVTCSLDIKETHIV